jgi:pyruvate/2-oxoglutarate dehydrogenase complex dihydrolipoamide acyltransferase (E2) component
VEEGQEIAAGDVLAEIETDKATMDWESQVPLPASQITACKVAHTTAAHVPTLVCCTVAWS